MNNSPPLASARIRSATSRMTLDRIVRGKLRRPVRVLLYGVEGVGKSTFAAQAPSPIFLCSEDGVAHLDIARFPQPSNWSELFDALLTLRHEQHSFETLVIDTIDWLEPMCWAHLCARANKHNIEEFGYGRGYALALDEWRKFLDALQLVIREKNMHIILLGHASVRRMDDPQVGGFDRFRLKLHDKAGDLIREWADAVLFARHEIFTSESSSSRKTRAHSTGARIMHTQWSAAFDAKNRFNLPPQMPLSWQDFELATGTSSPSTIATLQNELRSWINVLPDADDQQKAQDAMAGWAKDDPVRLSQLINRVKAKVGISNA